MSQPFACYLKVYRKKNGLTQTDLARLLTFTTKSNVSQYERAILVPQFEPALRMQMLFGVPIEELFPAFAESVGSDLVCQLEALVKELEAQEAKVDEHKLIALANMHSRLRHFRTPRV